MSVEYRQELEPGPAAVPSGRRAVHRLLVSAGRDREVVEAAELLTTELLTNAIRHDGPGPVVLRVSLGPVVRVSVHDNDDAPPVRHLSADQDLGGRGLLLVEAVATRWGWRPEGGGKEVWFELG